MRLGVWARGAVVVFVALGASACTSGLEGAAVGSSPPPATVTVAPAPPFQAAQSPTPPNHYGGAANLLSNPSFEHDSLPWQPFPKSSLELTRRPRRFGHKALLVGPTAFKPFGAQVRVISNPTRSRTYAASAWVKGSRSLVGGRIYIQLWGMTAHGPVGFAAVPRTVTGRWQRLRVSGKPTLPHPLSLGVWIYATTSIALSGWFAVDGVDVTEGR
ncbi:MAG: hypothetical protein ACRDLM_12215 [Gaiellaceae bacterium]